MHWGQDFTEKSYKDFFSYTLPQSGWDVNHLHDCKQQHSIPGFHFYLWAQKGTVWVKPLTPKPCSTLNLLTAQIYFSVCVPANRPLGWICFPYLFILIITLLSVNQQKKVYLTQLRVMESARKTSMGIFLKQNSILVIDIKTSKLSMR